jgi:hypothetical protein
MSHSAQRSAQFFAACLLALVLVGGCSAQDSNPRLSLIAGGSSFLGSHSFTASGRNFRSQFATGGDTGFRITLDFANPWSFEGTYSYGTNNLRMDTLNSSGTVTAEHDFGARVIEASGNALYFIGTPVGRLRLFAAAGLGLTNVSPTAAAVSYAATHQFVAHPANITGSTSPDFNIGVVLAQRIGRNWGLRVDLRDHFSSIPQFGLPQSGSGTTDFYPVTGHVSHFETSVGLVYYLRAIR